MDTRLFTAIKPTTLSSGTSIGTTSITPAFIKDREDNSIATMATYFGTKAFGVIGPNTSREEHFSFTGISAGVLTGVSHVSMVAPYTETSGLSEAHAAGEVVIIQTNSPAFYNELANKQNDETIVGTWTFNELPTLDSYEAPTNSAQLAAKGYVDSVVGGIATTDRLVVAGTAGETVAAGNLVYLKAADGFWWKCDADTASTVDNVILGIAQGSGTAGNAIASGVLTRGLDTNQSGMTIGAIQYASNTAGAISSSPGTTEVAIGQARSATNLYFFPRFNQNITEAQQDLLDAITADATEINKLDGYTGTTADLNEMSAIVQATNITGAELETLSSSATSNADSLHTHNNFIRSSNIELLFNTASASAIIRSSGFSDATEDAVMVGVQQSTTDVVHFATILMSNDIGASPYILSKSSSSLGSSSTSATTDVIRIGSDNWNSESTASEIRKNGSAVTISGTSRFGPLGHNATDGQLLVMYSTTKIAKFTGISGTTITNANDDVTLDTAVTQTGFAFDDTNNYYVCVDRTANVLRKFNSSGTTVETASYTIDDSGNTIVGVCLIGDRYHLVRTYETTFSGLNVTALAVSFIPTTMTR